MNIQQFIDEWCSQNGTTKKEIMAMPRSRLRQKLLVAAKLKFPSLSSVRMGQIFNLDHSTVINAWRKYNLPPKHRAPPATPELVQMIKDLRDKGESYFEIGQKFNMHQNTVRSHVDEEFRLRCKGYRAKQVAKIKAQKLKKLQEA